MSTVCSIWGCNEIAEHKDLYEMPDGNTCYLYYCWKHKKVKDDKDKIAILRRQISTLTEKLEALQNVCAEAYQLAGMCGAPEKALDNLCAAAQGEPIPHESFLPVYEKDLELGEKLEAWREYGKEAQEIFGYSTHEEPWFIKLRELGEVE